MTCHAIVLFAMAYQQAHGREVYRCTGPQNQISYQSGPCAGSPSGTPSLRQQHLKVADQRTEDQVRQALDNRQRDGFDTPRAAKANKTTRAASRRTRNKPVATATAQQDQAAQPPGKRQSRKSMRDPAETTAKRAGALTSHRLGERPFEHVRTPLSDSPPRRQARPKDERPRDFTARAPAGTQSTRSVKAQN